MQQQSILMQIYCGKRGTVNNEIESENYKSINHKMIEFEKVFRDIPEVWEAYMKLEALYGERESDLAIVNYLEGYKVGFLAALEVIGYSEPRSCTLKDI